MADQHGKYEDRFKNAEAMVPILDGDWREGWQYADEVIRAIATRDNLNVVELGAGTGYFARRLARVLPKGRILALDPEEAMVAWISEKVVPKDDLKNVTAKVIPFDDPMLGEVPFVMDVLLIAYTYHHMGPLDVRVPYMRDKVRPHMPDDALLIFVDFEEMPENKPEVPDEHGHHHGPHDHPDFIPPEELKKEMDSAGFSFVTDYGYNHKPNYMLAFKVKT